MSFSLLDLFIFALATFRLTHLIVFDKIFEPVRSYFVVREFEMGPDGPNVYYTLQGGSLRRFIGQLMNCFWCAGIWVAAIIVAGYHIDPIVTKWVTLIFALAGVQGLIHQAWFKAVGGKEFIPKK